MCGAHEKGQPECKGNLQDENDWDQQYRQRQPSTKKEYRPEKNKHAYDLIKGGAQNNMRRKKQKRKMNLFQKMSTPT